MNARAVAIYCDRLQMLIRYVSDQYEIIEEDAISPYQEDKLKALKQLHEDLCNIKRVENFFNN